MPARGGAAITESGYLVMGERKTVSSGTCAEYRRKVRQGKTTMTELAETGPFAMNTISYHVSGNCQHEHNEVPLARYERNSNMKISEENCAEIRQEVRDNPELNIVEISDSYSVEHGSVLKHLHGGCACSHNIKAVDKTIDYTELSAETCKLVRELYEDIDNMVKVARKVGRDYSTVRYHVKGQCSHVNEDLVGEIKPAVDRKKCENIRESLIRGKEFEEVTDEFEVSISTVKRHMRAECNCSDGPVLVKVRDPEKIRSGFKMLTKGECLKVLELYWEDHLAPDKIAEKIGCTKDTVLYHANQKCDHEFDDDTKYVFI